MRIIPRRNITYYKGELRDILGSILQGKLREGPYIKQFEEQFAKYIGTKYAIAVASGRLGLFLILDSLSLDKNSGVILPAYTDESVPAVIKMLGFEPIFIDIDRKTHNIDPGLIEREINEKTKVIIATHLFGRPCALSKIMEIAKRHNLTVIEDCAHAIGAEYNAKRVGSFGTAAYFSFGISKPFNTFGGGMITTNDPGFYSRIREKIADFNYPNTFTIIKNMFISYCLYLVTEPLAFSVLIFPLLFLLSLLGKDPINIYNKTVKRAINFGKIKIRYTNVQALAGLKQLKDFDAGIEKRIFNAALLARSLVDRGINTLEDNTATRPVYYFFVILAQDIETLSRRLLMKGIDTGKYIMRDCSTIYGSGTNCLCTKEALRISLQIPIYPRLNEIDIEYIAGALNQAFKNRLVKSSE